VCFWNVNNKAPEDYVLEEMWTQLADYKVVCLTETGLDSDESLTQAFPNYKAFVLPAAQHTRGHGLATLVHMSWAGRVHLRTVSHTSHGHQVLVVVADASVFGCGKPVAIVNCYLPHARSVQLQDTPLY
jgi:Tat protein secretion system quality control protein TatD with DNase activity